MAAGRFIALAVYHKQPIPMSFSRIACKHALARPIGMEDVRNIDPEFYRSRVESVMRDGGLEELQEALGEPLYFMSAPTELRPEPEELKPGGATIAVTSDNKLEYVELLCEAFLCGGIRRELQCMLRGFWQLLPQEALAQAGIAPSELSVLISGISDLDPADWERHSRDSPGDRPEILQWFWQFVRELSTEERCMLLHFVTGSSRLPQGGFATLRPSFSVVIVGATDGDHLPIARTCFNRIDLAGYRSYADLAAKVRSALAVEGFGIV